MYPQSRSIQLVDQERSIYSLQQLLIRLAFINLFIVALIGLTLRSYPFFHIPFSYKNLLHGHSHFAFGGWIMPLLIWLITRYFPELCAGVPFKHWRNIVFMIFFSAYGMLASFPFQGYGPVSISFSTISVLAGFYLAWVIWRSSKQERQITSVRFLNAGLFYLVLSSIGPFATGPLAALGYAGTPLYFNAIYFFLHFQYNGWFSFVILAVLVKILEEKQLAKNANSSFILLHLACIPTFFLSILWNHPGHLFNLIGGLAALIQIAAFIFLIPNLRSLNTGKNLINLLIRLALFGFIIKLVLQLASAFPLVADIAFLNRNFIIAYLHLVLVAFVSLSGIAFVLKLEPSLLSTQMKAGISIFIFSSITSEVLLITEPIGRYLNFSIPFLPNLLFYFSCFFPVSALWMALLVNRNYTLLNRIQLA
ncbi:MAG: hypothetical protein ACJ749_03380 [Flavisolibacter sp.]